MGSPSSQPVFFDWRAATFARLTRPVVDGVLELKRAWVAVRLLVRVVRERAAPSLDRSSHDRFDCRVQALGLRFTQFTRLGMNFSLPQAFIRVNVADARNRFL